MMILIIAFNLKHSTLNLKHIQKQKNNYETNTHINNVFAFIEK